MLKATSIQILGVLGIFFVFGFILSKLQEWTQTNYRRSIGWKGILWTAWFGTPFHELGHAFFAKLFRHKIIRIKLFQPNELTGELGQVDHTYHARSLYQKIGNFFIGGAPMIFGSLILWLLVYFVLPEGKAVFQPLNEASTSIPSLLNALAATLTNLFSLENITSWHFWLFLYLSFCISSHLAPSKADRKGMWSGFFWIVLVLFLANIFAVLFKLNITEYILKTSQYLGIFTAIFLYATVISITHWLLSAVLLRPFR